MPSITLQALASFLNLPAPSANPTLTGLSTLTEATETDLSFLGSDKYIKDFEKTRAAAVLVDKKVKLPGTTTIPTLIVSDANLAIAQILSHFSPPVPAPARGIDPTARIASSASVDPTAAIGPHVIVGERSRIGANSILHANVFIGSDVQIGSDCQFFPNVVIRERITIGNRVTINASSVLGTDGFGYRWDGQKHAKIPQIGTVIIEDDVEIGSCVCIDRAKFSATCVGKGTKIDNLVQIAHNVIIGPHCIITGQAGIAGSARLGAGVILGGQSAIRDHISLADRAMVAACSGVHEDVPAGQVVSGLPALNHRQSLREQAALRRLPELVTQVRKLQDEVEEMKKQISLSPQGRGPG